MSLCKNCDHNCHHSNNGKRASCDCFNCEHDIEEALEEGYFKTNDEVKLIIIRNNNFIEFKLRLIDPYNKG